MRHSTKTMIGLQPDSTVPFPLAEGRRSGMRPRSTVRMVRGELRFVPPRPRPAPKQMNNADAQFFCFGCICFVMALIFWATS